MPKIIKNLHKKIFDEAEIMFCQNGFYNTDMKAIAKACDIAVGTLYNYYPNKKELYLKVFTRSWNETFCKLKVVIQLESDKKDMLKGIIEILYTDTEARNGLGKDMLLLDISEDFELKEVKKELFDNLAMIMAACSLKDEFKKYNKALEKIIMLLISMQITLIKEFPESRQENIEIIYKALEGYIG